MLIAEADVFFGRTRDDGCDLTFGIIALDKNHHFNNCMLEEECSKQYITRSLVVLLTIFLLYSSLK